jgi:hypothetical protein
VTPQVLVLSLLATVPLASVPPAGARAPAVSAVDGAVSLLEKGDAPAAERRLREELVRGGGALTRGLLAAALLRQDRADDAEKELRSALASGPTAPVRLREAGLRAQSPRLLLLLARLHAEAG